MSRTKLKKFSKLNKMSHVIQPDREELLSDQFSIKGHWKKKFKNNNPIILELGCGKGEYSVGLAKKYPENNYIGIDIKGARIYSGADLVRQEELKNVYFIRTQIEYISSLFSSEEIDEIWITFPDPQIKFNRRKKRLTHPSMLEKYKTILKRGGLIHLKTDSLFLHGYTLGVLTEGPYKVLHSTHDLYSKKNVDERLAIKTHYEKLFLENNHTITHLSFSFLY